MTELHIDHIFVPIVELAPLHDGEGQLVDFGIVATNRAADQMFAPGERPGAKLNERLTDSFPELIGTELFDSLCQVIETGAATSIEFRPSDTRGLGDLLLNISIGPSPAGCVMSVHDVTEMSRQRDHAQDRYSLMHAACDSAVIGVAIACSDSNLRYVNPAFCKMLGYSEEELLTLKISDIMHPDELENRYEDARQLIRSEIDQYVLDRRYIMKSGEEILLAVAVSSVPDPDGEDDLSLGYFRDVRAERLVQQELKDALERAEEATRLKSEFLANMSHEIRTPLNGVIGMAQVLAHSGLTEEQSEHLAIIRDSSSNLMSLLNDILDLSKVEAGKLDINPTEMDPRHKLYRVFKLHEPTAEEKGVDLRLIIHPSVPSRLLIDPVRVRQCVDNLVSNAVKFTQKGQVIIAVASEPVGQGGEHEIVVHVSDTGVGIEPDKLGRIFDSFQQADGSTTRNYGGSGLGLTITRRLAELMGGSLTVVSEKGRRSVFTLTLRAKGVQIAHQDNAQALPMSGVEPSAGVSSFAGRRALIVDDNLINRQVARALLRGFDFEIEEAVDGFEGVAKAAETAFDVVLMDIHMPSMDGVTALRKIRKGGSASQHAPIIALTADAMAGDRERYLAMGMDAYVAKPLNERELMTEVGRVLLPGGGAPLAAEG